jgi:dienelactone hydrolase
MIRLSLLLALLLYVPHCWAAKLEMLPKKEGELQHQLLKFSNDSLEQSALLVIGSPEGLLSTTLIVMAHGFHPNPPQYGMDKNGQSSRPGDYYRNWVNAYAQAGFNVLVPDYRGHNDSQGLSYTHQVGSVDFPEQNYALDLIASVQALQDYLQLMFPKLIFVGHSMGSPIAFYAADQFASQVKLVSLWSSAANQFPTLTSAPKYVLHHGKYDDVTPITHLDYYLKNYKNQLVSKNIYETNEHMLTSSDFEQAVSLDIRLINGILKDK